MGNANVKITYLHSIKRVKIAAGIWHLDLQLQLSKIQWRIKNLTSKIHAILEAYDVARVMQIDFNLQLVLRVVIYLAFYSTM